MLQVAGAPATLQIAKVHSAVLAVQVVLLKAVPVEVFYAA